MTIATVRRPWRWDTPCVDARMVLGRERWEWIRSMEMVAQCPAQEMLWYFTSAALSRLGYGGYSSPLFVEVVRDSLPVLRPGAQGLALPWLALAFADCPYVRAEVTGVPSPGTWWVTCQQLNIQSKMES